MTKALTPGKWRGLKATSSTNHTFSMLAFDQRGNYVRMLPEGTTYAQAAHIKRTVIHALSPYTTAVLLDPNYGLPAVLDVAGTSGLLMALEKTGYSGDSTAREIDFMEGWNVAKIKHMGASAVKLLVYYHPDTGTVAENIETTIRQIGEECVAHDIAFFVEPLAYSPDPAIPGDSAVFAEQRPMIVRETARRLSKLPLDVLKLEFPVDVKRDPDQDHWREACDAVSSVCEVPWVLLSAGVDFELFSQQVEIVCRSGASGFLGGRAIWKESVTMPQPEQEQFLSTTGIQRVKQLREITKQHGRPWTDFFAAPETDENWFLNYAKGLS